MRQKNKLVAQCKLNDREDLIYQMSSNKSSREKIRSVPNKFAENKDIYKFKDLCIAVITERNSHGDLFIRELQKTRAEVKHIWPCPDIITSEYDIVFSEMVSNLPSRIDSLPGLPKFSLIIIIPQAGTVDLKLLENCAPHGTIHLPANHQAILSVLTVARSHYLYENRLRKRIQQLDDNLVSMKNIERAKTLLMQQMNLSEDQAHKHIQRQAMERRITVSAVAKTIIDAQELFS